MTEDGSTGELMLDTKEKDYLFSISGPIEATNEYVWQIDGSASDLPDYDCGGPFAGLKKTFKRHYKSPHESVGQYLERVLRSFQLYVGEAVENGECAMVARKHGLCIWFTLIPQQMKIKSKRSTIFTPTPSNPKSVIVEGEVAIHHKLVKFVSFSRKYDSDHHGQMSRVSLPDNIRFEHK